MLYGKDTIRTCTKDDERIWPMVYAKGKFEMGGFVNLMERVEYKGKEIVYKDEDGILIS